MADVRVSVRSNFVLNTSTREVAKHKSAFAHLQSAQVDGASIRVHATGSAARAAHGGTTASAWE